jgi:WD40 repeat protein
MNLQSPYPGLRPFRPDESDIFFGREEQTDHLLRKLGATRFLAVTGASGCGKSSLVLAGMIPALETGFMVRAGSRWRIAIMRPGSQPITNMASALLKSGVGTHSGSEPVAAGFLTAVLRRGPLGLVEVLRETPLPEGTNLLILVDQFEEILRYRDIGDAEEANAFVSLLLESASQPEVAVYVVMTMRSDYLGNCANFQGLPELLSQSQYLTPRLTRDQRRDAIVCPARVFGGDVKADLLNRLLNDSGSDPNQLPVLQHLLMRMWTCHVQSFSAETSSQAFVEPDCTDGTSHILTMADYVRVGEFVHALSNHANEAFNELDKTQQSIAELMFRRLCERGEGGRDVRRPTSVGEIQEICAAALGDTPLAEVIEVANVFRESRHQFLTPPESEQLDAGKVLDITHESLISRWDRLNKWSEKEKESVREYRFLTEAAQRWPEQGALWGTPDLEAALKWKEEEKPSKAWATRYGGDFDLAERFLNASQKKQAADKERNEAEYNRELEQAKQIATAARASARLSWAVAVLAGILLSASVVAVFFLRLEVEQSRSRELAAFSSGSTYVDPENGIKLALKALDSSNTTEARDALQQAVNASHAVRTLNVGGGTVWNAAFSSDGKKIATAAADGTTRIWDTFSGKPLQSFADHAVKNGRKDVYWLAWNPKCEVLASVGADGELYMRDLAGNKQWFAERPEPESGAYRVKFCGNGSRMATSGVRDIVIRDASGRPVLPPIKDLHGPGMTDLAFSPDCSRLATAGSDGSWTLWDANKGKKLFHKKAITPSLLHIADYLGKLGQFPFSSVLPHSEEISGITYGPRGLYIATASQDRTVKLWGAKDGGLRSTIAMSGYEGGVNNVRFSPDGARLATAGDDRIIKIWDISSERPLLTLAGHSGPVYGLDFNPDGNLLVTSSGDGTAKIWDVTPSHKDEVYALAFSPDGGVLASAGRDSEVILWRVPRRPPLERMGEPLEGHSSTISVLAFDPEQSHSYIVTGGADSRVIVWDIKTRNIVWERDKENGGHKGQVTAVAFGPDGVVASGGDDGDIILWDSSGNKLWHKSSEDVVNISGLAFRPGRGRQIVAAAVNVNRTQSIEGDVFFYDVHSGDEYDVGLKPVQPSGITGVAFSSDGQFLATSSPSKGVIVWDLIARKKVRSLPHPSYVTGVAFSHRGRLLATSSQDHFARVWELSSGKLLDNLSHPAMVNAVEFSPNDQYLATACDDNTVRLMPMNVETLKTIAKSHLTNPFQP